MRRNVAMKRARIDVRKSAAPRGGSAARAVVEAFVPIR
jgi:hypothetical protein